MSNKAEAKALEVAAEFAEHNEHRARAFDEIDYVTRQYRNPGEPITECVMRLLAEVLQFRCDEVRTAYVKTRQNRMEAEKGGAQ